MSMPLQQAPIVSCSSCKEELQHCHGTAVLLDGVTHVCSEDPDCTLEVAEHWFVALDEQ
jgi:hypothetical protein